MSVPIKYSPGLSTLGCQFLRCHGRLLIKPTTRIATLMPRVVRTNRVLSVRIDPAMNSQPRQRRQQGETDIGTHKGGNNGNRDTKLHSAVRSGNLGEVRAILKNEPSLIESQDEQGWTPLSNAAYEGHCNIVGYLLKEFPKSISKANGDGSFPVHKACIGGHIKVLKMFSSKCLSQGDRHGHTVLHLAAKEPGDRLKHVVTYLMSTPEGRTLTKRRDENERSPLRLAMQMNNQGVVEIINRSMR